MPAPVSQALPTIEFLNLVPELLNSGDGFLLARYPGAVRHAMESPGFLTSQESTGGEMRFVTPAMHARVCLSALNQDVEVAVYRGNFQHSSQTLRQGVSHCLQLTPPERFPQVRPEVLAASGFHPDVWRIVFNRGAAVFQWLETFGQAVRPPDKLEKPRLRWLAYGSSITHSSMNGYPHQAARRLGVDVLNKGLSGSCYIEAEAVEFLAADCEWDFATLELGINMRDRFTPAEFARRARHLVRRCLEAKPGRPIFLITVFPNFASRPHALVPDASTGKEEAFIRDLRQIAQDYRDEGVRLIEGSDIVDDFSYMSTDLLHPTEYGHNLMGQNLARTLAPTVAQLSSAEDR
jgi:lysophospholipase L1-like esterase